LKKEKEFNDILRNINRKQKIIQKEHKEKNANSMPLSRPLVANVWRLEHGY